MSPAVAPEMGVEDHPVVDTAVFCFVVFFPSELLKSKTFCLAFASRNLHSLLLPSPTPSQLSAAVSWHCSKFYFSVSLPNNFLQPTLCQSRFLLLDILNLHNRNNFSPVTSGEPELRDVCGNSLGVTFPLGCAGGYWVFSRPGFQGLG